MDECLLPFYLIGHNPNTFEEAEAFLAAGANALEPDVQRDPFTNQLIIAHGRRLADTDPIVGTPLNAYLAGLLDLAGKYPSFALVIFDSKLDDGPSGEELRDAVHKTLGGAGLTIIYSVASIAMRSFLDPIIVGSSDPREAVMVDEEANCDLVVDSLESLGATRIAYGDGIIVALGAPRVHNEIRNALARRLMKGRPQFVDTWVLADEGAIIDYISMGIDGIIVNIDTVGAVIAYMKRPEIARQRTLASRSHNPFAQTHNGWTLNVHTLDRGHAGTDAKISFSLRGSGPDEVSPPYPIDGSIAGYFESGAITKVPMYAPCAKLGDPTSVVIRHGGTGNAPAWIPDRIELESQGQPTLYCDIGSWISGGDEQEFPLGSAVYKLIVKTTKKAMAGTDADIVFTLKGSNGIVRRRVNALPPGILESGSIYTFDIRGIDVGSIISLSVENDGTGNAPDWHLSEVRVVPSNVLDKKAIRFRFDQWIKAESIVEVNAL